MKVAEKWRVRETGQGGCAERRGGSNTTFGSLCWAVMEWPLANQGRWVEAPGSVLRATGSLLPRAPRCNQATRLATGGESARLYFNCGAAATRRDRLRVAAARWQ